MSIFDASLEFSLDPLMSVPETTVIGPVTCVRVCRL